MGGILSSDASSAAVLTETDPHTEGTVLAVDDTPDRLQLLEVLLRQSGYRVLTAAEGREGLKIALDECPDLIISDVSMPVMDGIELCRRVRADARLSAVPFLLVSAMRKDSESVVEGLRAGADDYLEAPYDPMRLIALSARLVERGRYEKTIHESEERFRAFVDHFSEGIWHVEVDPPCSVRLPADEQVEHCLRHGRVADCNDVIAKTYGFSRAEEMAGLRLAQLLPYLGAGYTELLRNFVRRGYSLTNAESEEGIAGAEVRCFLNDLAGVVEGRVIRGWWRTKRDITEHKRAEKALRESAQALRESERRYRLLFESNPQPMWVFDEETHAFLAVNRAAVEKYGYSPEEFLSMTVKDIRPPEDVPALMEDLARRPRGLGAAGLWRHRRKDGSVIDVEITSHGLDFAGRAAQLVLATDVTERKRAQDALRDTEEQLRQAQKLEAVGRLAGGVAHDFNNLLTVISGYSDMTLRALEADSPLRGRVEEIRRAAARASSLTRQLLAFSRKQVLQPVVLDLNAVVSDMDEMLRRLIGEDIHLVTVLDRTLRRVKADPGQIGQVIMNLAVNARDAMPSGGQLTIETGNVYLDETYASRHVAVTPGPYVMLAVSDTGTGMDAETRARIFEPFFTTKETGKGTGLGLSTVYGIVRQSGGNVWVYSEPGHGTTFKVYLPAAEGGASEERAAEPKAARGTETILLVEDEESVRLLLLDILEAEGYTVLVARDGHEALHVCGQHEGAVNLLLTDVVMPGMSGRQLVEQLAQYRPGMKVLYMSGYTDDAIVRHGMLETGMAFLQKPFTPDAVARKVREVLDVERPGRRA